MFRKNNLVLQTNKILTEIYKPLKQNAYRNNITQLLSKF